MKITEGKWELFSSNSIVSDKGKVIAIAIAGVPKKEYEANARAISRVPEMIKFLEQIVSEWGDKPKVPIYIAVAEKLLSEIEG